MVCCVKSHKILKLCVTKKNDLKVLEYLKCILFKCVHEQGYSLELRV